MVMAPLEGLPPPRAAALTVTAPVVDVSSDEGLNSTSREARRRIDPAVVCIVPFTDRSFVPEARRSAAEMIVNVPSMLRPPEAATSVRSSTLLVLTMDVDESSVMRTVPVECSVSEPKLRASAAAYPSSISGAVRSAFPETVTDAEAALLICAAPSSVSVAAELLPASSMSSSSKINTVPVVWKVTDPSVTAPAAATVILPPPVAISSRLSAISSTSAASPAR